MVQWQFSGLLKEWERELYRQACENVNYVNSSKQITNEIISIDEQVACESESALIIPVSEVQKCSNDNKVTVF